MHIVQAAMSCPGLQGMQAGTCLTVLLLRIWATCWDSLPRGFCGSFPSNACWDSMPELLQLTDQLSLVTAERGELAEGAAGAKQCLPEPHAPSPPRPARCWRSIWRVWRGLRPAVLWRWPARLWSAGRLWSASRLPAGLWGWVRAVLTASADAQHCFSRLTPV